MKSFSFNLDSCSNGWADNPLSGHLNIQMISSSDGGLNAGNKVFSYRLYRITRTRPSQDDYGLELIFSNVTSPYYLYLRYPVAKFPNGKYYPTEKWPDPKSLEGFEKDMDAMMGLPPVKNPPVWFRWNKIDHSTQAPGVKAEVKRIFTKWFGDLLDMDTVGLGPPTEERE